MSKIIEAIGGTKANPLGEEELNITGFIRNLAIIVFSAIAIAFAAGSKLSTARGLPDRVKVNEQKVEVLERMKDVYQVQLENIATTLTSLKIDVREIRTAQMRQRKE